MANDFANDIKKAGLDTLIFKNDGSTIIQSSASNIGIDISNPNIKQRIYNEQNYNLEAMARAQGCCVPPELRNEYCLMFGKNVLHHSTSYSDIKQKQQECNGLVTTIYCPDL